MNYTTALNVELPYLKSDFVREYFSSTCITLLLLELKDAGGGMIKIIELPESVHSSSLSHSIYLYIGIVIKRDDMYNSSKTFP